MISKKEFEAQEKKTFMEVIKDKSIIGLLGYVIRFKLKELLGLVVILLVWYILSSNISVKDGKIEWVPSIRTSIEIKK